MKHNVPLTIASLLSILLLILHVADDIAHGIGKAGPGAMADLSDCGGSLRSLPLCCDSLAGQRGH